MATIKLKPFDVRRSVQNAAEKASFNPIRYNASDFSGAFNGLERVEEIRAGISYSNLEIVSKRLNEPVESVLGLAGILIATYDPQKHENLVLNSRDSELILLINDLIDYGLEVFNGEEEKFQRWLKKPNLSLGGYVPETLLDTVTGITEVRFALNRLDSGNLA